MNSELNVYLVWAAMEDGSERRASIWAVSKARAKKQARKMFKTAINVVVI